ncbi:hypothetical protein BDV24DRAFT_144964 [Aspergillus arachidicola]|uniref:Uncharacterized protein n=1 Tax=Aspergillus arachidicola TaxID=656916 RepID=A0A5N6XPT6_9EURO|nr:hypothetical protein BDV24DRAFT_144964 [Aspergillus arachidicola]
MNPQAFIVILVPSPSPRHGAKPSVSFPWLRWWIMSTLDVGVHQPFKVNKSVDADARCILLPLSVNSQGLHTTSRQDAAIEKLRSVPMLPSDTTEVRQQSMQHYSLHCIVRPMA